MNKAFKDLAETIGIKFLLEDLLEEARNHTIDFEFGGEHYGEFKYENVEITYEYIDKYNPKIEEYKESIKIYDVKVYDYVKLLKDSGLAFEKSDQSESVYISLDDDLCSDTDRIIRVSTHKRPPYEHGGLYYEWNYHQEIIVKDEIAMYSTIKNIIKELKK